MSGTVLSNAALPSTLHDQASNHCIQVHGVGMEPSVDDNVTVAEQRPQQQQATSGRLKSAKSRQAVERSSLAANPDVADTGANLRFARVSKLRAPPDESGHV